MSALVARGEGLLLLGCVCFGMNESRRVEMELAGDRQGCYSIDFMYAIVERMIRVLFQEATLYKDCHKN
jgi:hypothetical protein